MSTETPATEPTAEEAAAKARPADTQPAAESPAPAATKPRSDTVSKLERGGIPPMPQLPSFLADFAKFLNEVKGPQLWNVVWGPQKGECQLAVVRAENAQEAAKIIRKDLTSPDGETIHLQVYGYLAHHYELV